MATSAHRISVFDAIRAEAVSDEEVVLDRMERSQEIVTGYLNDPAFRAVVDQKLARTYDEIRNPNPSIGPLVAAYETGGYKAQNSGPFSISAGTPPRRRERGLPEGAPLGREASGHRGMPSNRPPGRDDGPPGDGL